MLAAQDTFRGFGPLIFIGFVLCAVVSYAMMAQLYRMLRERHPTVSLQFRPPRERGR